MLTKTAEGGGQSVGGRGSTLDAVDLLLRLYFGSWVYLLLWVATGPCWPQSCPEHRWVMHGNQFPFLYCLHSFLGHAMPYQYTVYTRRRKL